MNRSNGLKALSLVLAVILWAYVKVTVGGISQKIESQLELQIPLEIKGSGTNLIPYEKSSDTVKVTLRGDSEIVSDLREGLVRASVDVESMVAGSHWPEVRVLVPDGVAILDVNPSSVNVKLSPPLLKDVAVKIETAGKPRDGYQAAEPKFEPRTLKLQGPEALLSQVSHVVGLVPLDNEDTSVSVVVTNLTPVNENGTAVMASDSAIRMTPRKVSATIPIEIKQSLHTLPVLLDNVRVEGNEKFTYNIEVRPQFVQVNSRLPKSQSLPAGMKTKELVLAMGEEVRTARVLLEAVEGLAPVGDGSVEITVKPKKKVAPNETDSSDAE